MSVRRATSTKSCVLIRSSRGSFASGLIVLETVGGGFNHSSVRDSVSSVPRILEGSREVRIREGA